MLAQVTALGLHPKLLWRFERVRFIFVCMWVSLVFHATGHWEPDSRHWESEQQTHCILPSLQPQLLFFVSKRLHPTPEGNLPNVAVTFKMKGFMSRALAHTHKNAASCSKTCIQRVGKAAASTDGTSALASLWRATAEDRLLEQKLRKRQKRLVLVWKHLVH
jgi:hypothetical protein